MTDHRWRTLGTLTQTDAPNWTQALAQQLATLVHELNIPALVLERMQTVASAAVCRSFQRDNTRTVQVIVSAQVLPPEDNLVARSWGFFLIEKSSDGALCQHIAVQLYPDECIRRPEEGNS